MRSFTRVFALIGAAACAGGSPDRVTGPGSQAPQPSAARLVFEVQPYKGMVGQAIAPTMRVTVQDRNGAVVPTASGSVAMALSKNLQNAELQGVTVVPLVAGVAIVNNLTVSKPGENYVLEATALGMTTRSDPFSVVPPPTAVDSSILQLLSDSAAIVAGQLNFRVPSGQSPKIDSGSVIIGAEKGGFIRKVIASSQSGNVLSLRTAEGQLSDAVRSSRISQSTQFDLSEANARLVPRGDGWGPVRFRPLHDGIRIENGEIVLDGTTILDLGNGDGIVLKVGRIGFAPTFVFDGRIDDWKVQELVASVTGNIRLRGQLLGRMTLASKRVVVTPITEIGRDFYTSIPGTILPLVMTVTLKLSTVAYAEASARVDGQSDFDGSAGLTIGGHYTAADGWSLLSDERATLAASPIQLSVPVQAGIGFGLRADLSVTFYKAAESYLFGAATSGFTTTLDASRQEFRSACSLDTEYGVGLQFKVWSFELARFETSRSGPGVHPTGCNVTVPLGQPVQRVVVDPPTATLNIGDVKSLTAKAYGPDGTEIGRALQWNSDHPEIAAVSSAGIVTAVAEGRAQVSASADGKVGSSSITVLKVPVASVTVVPASPTMEIGSTRILEAVVRDASGKALTGRMVEWSSSAPAIVTVGQDGTARAIASGQATIVASSEGKTGHATVSVVPVLGGLDIEIQGVPTGVTPSVSVRGGTVNQTLAASTTLQVPPGTYTISGPEIATPTQRCTATPPMQSATVNAGQTSRIVVAYTCTPIVGALQVSPTAVAFNASRNAAGPPAQSVALTASTGAISGLTHSTSYAIGSGWLSVSLSGSTTPATMNLQPSTTALSPGVYTATVTVTGSGGGTAIVGVSYIVVEGVQPLVTTQPATGISTTGLTMNGSINPQGQSPVDYWFEYGVNNTGCSPFAATSARRLANGATTAIAVSDAVVGGTPGTTVSFRLAASRSGGTVQRGSCLPATLRSSTLQASPSGVSFAGTQGGSRPTSRSVALTASEGSITGLALAISYASGTGWLNAALSVASTPATLTLQPVGTALTAGTYTATVTVSGSSNATVSITVTYTVAPMVDPLVATQPATAISTTGLTMNGTVNPQGQSPVDYWFEYGVNNTGCSPFAATSPRQLVNGATTAVPVTDGLTSGTPGMTISFRVAASRSGGAAQRGACHVATLTSQSISVSPSGVSFSAIQNGALPSSKSASVTASSGTVSGLSATVAYSAGSGWLTASLTGTSTAATATIRPNTTALSPGTYSATVTVSAPGVSSRTISITYVVTGTPQLSLSPTALSFGATQGGSPPASKTVSITATSGAISGLTRTITYTSGATGWLSASLLSSTTSTTMTVSAAITGYNAGTYSATISVSGTGVSSKTVDVTYVIGPQGGNTTGSLKVNFSGLPSGNAPSLTLYRPDGSVYGGCSSAVSPCQFLSLPVGTYTLKAFSKAINGRTYTPTPTLQYPQITAGQTTTVSVAYQ